MKLGTLVFVLASVIPSPSVFAQTSLSPRPITIEDYFQIQAVHDPQLSPDGQWVVYAVDKAIVKTDKNETRIWNSRSPCIRTGVDGLMPGIRMKRIQPQGRPTSCEPRPVAVSGD